MTSARGLVNQSALIALQSLRPNGSTFKHGHSLVGRLASELLDVLDMLIAQTARIVLVGRAIQRLWNSHFLGPRMQGICHLKAVTLTQRLRRI
jgi:hypothetical protein